MRGHGSEIRTRGVYDGVSVRRGDVASASPPSRTPLLHAATIRRHEGEVEGGGHESDHDNGGEYTAVASVLVHQRCDGGSARSRRANENLDARRSSSPRTPPENSPQREGYTPRIPWNDA